MKPVVLSIAGSDPSGGAGIQADLKVFDRLGVYGMAVPAALTSQSTLGVTGARAVPSGFLRAQLGTLLGDVSPRAVKTGMLMDAPNVRAVADALRGLDGASVVVDPVMVSTSGRRLLSGPGIRTLVEELVPLSSLVTPNLDEAAVLCGFGVDGIDGMKRAAVFIHGLGPASVLIKGGHLSGDPADVFFDGANMAVLKGKRVPGGPFHGTGCVLSSAVAAYMAKGESGLPAVKKARAFLAGLMAKAARTGGGAIPLV